MDSIPIQSQTWKWFSEVPFQVSALSLRMQLHTEVISAVDGGDRDLNRQVLKL